MPNYAAFVLPLPIMYEQPITSSLDDGLNRPEAYEIAFAPQGFHVLTATAGTRAATPRLVRANDCFVFPEWSSNLFNHIIVRPSRLALGNVLTDQTRTVEVANLWLTTRSWSSLLTSITGLTFNNAPTFPLDILPFGSFLLEIGISADGPSTIIGSITIITDSETIVVPVSGRRVIVFHFKPLSPVLERLEWSTDMLRAEDGTEQRIALRPAPRQSFTYRVLPIAARSRRRVDALLFDWLDKIFAFPIWHEALTLTTPVIAGDLGVTIDTTTSDYRVGSSCMLFNDEESFEVLQVDAITPTALTFASAATRSYEAGAAYVMPVRTSYMRTVPSARRVFEKVTEYRIEFQVIDNVDLSDTTGASTYAGRVLLDDCNFIETGNENRWSRDVIVLDAETGLVFQQSLQDRSKFYTKKIWKEFSREDLWRVRRLVHSFVGNQKSFWLPSFSKDMQLSATIGPNALTLRVEETGITSFIGLRFPFADIRLVRTNGEAIIRRVIGVEADSDDDVLTISETFDAINPITAAEVARIEWVRLVRMSNDSVEITHEPKNRAVIEMDVVTTKDQ